MTQSNADSGFRVSVESSGYRNISVAERCTGCKDSVYLSQFRAKFLPQRVERFIGFYYTVLPKPSVEHLKMSLTTVMQARDVRLWLSSGFDHEDAFCACPIASKNLHHFSVNRNVTDAVFSFWMEKARRLNPDNALIPFKFGPFQEIDFVTPKPYHHPEQENFEKFGLGIN